MEGLNVGHIMVIVSIISIIIVKMMRSAQDNPQKISGQSDKTLDFQYQKALHTMDQHKTSHILHLLMTICTGGLWMFVWFACALSNSGKRDKAKRKLGQIEKAMQLKETGS